MQTGPSEFVFAVSRAIPALGAEPGDELIVRPHDRQYPLTLRRTFYARSLRHISHPGLRLIYADPPASPAAVRRVVERLGAQGALRLVP